MTVKARLFKLFCLLGLSLLFMQLVPPFRTASALGYTGSAMRNAPAADSQVATELPPQLKLVKDFLERMGAVDDKGQSIANRLATEYGTRVVLGKVSKGNAKTGPWLIIPGVTSAKDNIMTLNKSVVETILLATEYQIKKNKNIRDSVKSGVASWAQTVFHEYVHMNQDNPQDTPEDENDARRRAVIETVKWYKNLKDYEFEQIKKEPASPQKVEKLQELESMASGIVAALLTEYQEGIPNAIAEGSIGKDLDWAGLGGELRKDLKKLIEEAKQERDKFLKEIQDEIGKVNKGVLTPTPPPTMSPPPGTAPAYKTIAKVIGTFTAKQFRNWAQEIVPLMPPKYFTTPGPGLIRITTEFNPFHVNFPAHNVTAPGGVEWIRPGDTWGPGMTFFGRDVENSRFLPGFKYPAQTAPLKMWTVSRSGKLENIGVRISPPYFQSGPGEINVLAGSITVTIEWAKVPGDIDGDGSVGLGDQAILASSYGKTSRDPGFKSDADLNLDGVIDLTDLAMLAMNWIG